MKIDDEAALIYIILLLQIIQHHVLVEDGAIELIVPLLVEFLLCHQLANVDVSKLKGLVQ